MTIPPPELPVERAYEDIAPIPDQAHVWQGGWDGDWHQGRICGVCGEYSDCDMCKDIDANVDCLRDQAKERNRQKKKVYDDAIRDYEAQMRYYKILVDQAGDQG